jgi:hypothetical protein
MFLGALHKWFNVNARIQVGFHTFIYGLLIGLLPMRGINLKIFRPVA